MDHGSPCEEVRISGQFGSRARAAAYVIVMQPKKPNVHVGVFDRIADADRAVHELVGAGIPKERITVICPTCTTEKYEEYKKRRTLRLARDRGAATGGAIGRSSAASPPSRPERPPRRRPAARRSSSRERPRGLGGGAVFGGFVGAMLTRGLSARSRTSTTRLEKGQILVAVERGDDVTLRAGRRGRPDLRGDRVGERDAASDLIGVGCHRAFRAQDRAGRRAGPGTPPSPDRASTKPRHPWVDSSPPRTGGPVGRAPGGHMPIQKVGVVGCGLMGHGIAQVAAQGGCDVVVVETEQKFLDSGLARIEKSLAKLAEKAVEKGKPAEQAKADAATVRGRIRASLDRQALADRDSSSRRSSRTSI
jgi:hypothetical protein